MRIKQFNNEVLIADDLIVKVKDQDINMLKERAVRNSRKRIRLCAHKDTEDSLHEMLIVLGRETYIRPHKHEGKSESFHIIEGQMDVIVFDDDGNMTEIVQMGDYASGRRFYYRISDPYYHIPLIRSEVAVFHETTNGPFNRSDTTFSTWAPDESDISAGRKYLKQLALAAEKFISLQS
ncbi:MAG: WbuC family cupin fold metalloprotein [Desulfobacterales bacterium]|nr:WbuC family cupin fold metalloprotein [Desulfobacterales bacterium]